MPWIDPFMDRQQGRRFSTAFNDAYTELSQSNDFVSIGSAMGEAYGDMFLHGRPVGHAYVYRPSKLRSERLPVIVFLHGWLGNMKAYIWTWARFADEHGFVVICPTFRNGLWNGDAADGTLRWFDAVIRDAPACDPERVTVVGLSNGGTGVTRWATVLPKRFAVGAHPGLWCLCLSGSGETVDRKKFRRGIAKVLKNGRGNGRFSEAS